MSENTKPLQNTILRIGDEKTLKLVKLIKKEPCLWDREHQAYRMSDICIAAAERIARKLNVEHFKAQHVVLKFAYLRHNYCQELNKIRKILDMGLGEETMYRPKLAWFWKMDSFMRPQQNNDLQVLDWLDKKNEERTDIVRNEKNIEEQSSDSDVEEVKAVPSESDNSKFKTGITNKTMSEDIKPPQSTILRIGDEKTLELIEAVQKEPCLWAREHEEYYTSDVRIAAAERIAKKLNVKHFKAQHVVLKFSNLRDTYCHELQKIRKSLEMGLGEEAIYHPKLVWFWKMDSFIRPQINNYRPLQDWLAKNEKNEERTEAVHHEIKIEVQSSESDAEELMAGPSEADNSKFKTEKTIETMNEDPKPLQSKIMRIGKKKTLQLLELVKMKPCLWDREHEEYYTSDVRIAAAERIAKKLNVKHFKAQHVVLKFSNLRDAYCHELKKIRKSLEMGLGEEAIYHPKLVWFWKMDSFIRPQINNYRPLQDWLSKNEKNEERTEAVHHEIKIEVQSSESDAEELMAGPSEADNSKLMDSIFKTGKTIETMNEDPKHSQSKIMRIGKKKTLQLIELVKMKPCLWDREHEMYRMSGVRKIATEQIATELNVKHFEAKHVIKKFACLRNTYYKELKKIRRTLDMDLGEEAIHRPKLVWFSKIDSFIRPQLNDYLPVFEWLDKNRKNEERETVHHEVKIEEQSSESDVEEDNSKAMDSPKVMSFSERHEENIRQRKEPQLDQANNTSNVKQCRKRERSEDLDQLTSDAYDAFGRYVAAMLRAQPARALTLQQRIVALLTSQDFGEDYSNSLVS